MKKIDTKRIAIYGMVAAIYVAVTYACGSLAFMGFQFRISEALILLCFYKKDYIIPLTVGCFLANLNPSSPMLAWDLTAGVFATLLSAYLISKSKNIIIASLFPVIINAIVVGFGLYKFVGLPLILSMVQVAFGEFVCVSIVGVVLFKSLDKNKGFMKLIKFGKE